MAAIGIREHVTNICGVSLVIRGLEESEADLVYALTIEEGWGVTKSEIRLYLKHHSGYSVGAFSENGTLISACITLVQDEKQASLSHMITAKDYRGKGIGGHILQLTLVGHGERNIIVEAAARAVAFYKRASFRTDGLSMMVFTGIPKCPLDVVSPEGVSLEIINSKNVMEVGGFEGSICQSGNKPLAMDLWSCAEIVFKMAARQNGNIVGSIGVFKLPYGENVYRVSMFYADSYQIAKYLLSKSLESLPHESTIKTYCPNKNRFSHEILTQEFGLSGFCEKQESRMYTKYPTGNVLYQKVYSMYVNLI